MAICKVIDIIFKVIVKRLDLFFLDTAYCKNNDRESWFKHDDHEVTSISASETKVSLNFNFFS